MKNKWILIFYNAIPIILMIVLIPLIVNDYLLSLVYLIIIGISLYVKHYKNDFLVMCFGFVIMIIAETIFISTGVETFNRTSLLGIMPIWLPVLWGYSFIAIKRVVLLLR